MRPRSAIENPASRLLLVALALVCATGCVRRRLMVRSNPPGATVHVDNTPIGTTPCGVDFVYYGTREIRLSAPGYETLTINQPIPTPWYQLPGIDFFSENLLPTTVKDERVVSYNLVRQRMAPAEEIIARGEELRRQATPIGVAPLGATTPASFPSVEALPIETAPIEAAPGGTPSLEAQRPTLFPEGPPPVASPTPVDAPADAFRY